MDNQQLLSLLGLCLRGGNLAVGEEPVEGVARAKHARLLLLASDAAGNTMRRVRHFSEMGSCLWLPVPCTKAELGRAVGRSAVALVAVTDIGLANAVAKRLAVMDPVRYDEAAAQMELKAKRAAERRAEQLQHEKNVRSGKYKAKRPTPAAPAENASAEKTPTAKKPSAGKNADPGGKPYRKPDGNGSARRGSRPSAKNRPKPRAKSNPYAHSRPVKHGKGSFRKKED